MKPWLSAALAGAWLFHFGSGNARADTKFELGARLGYGVPFGRGTSDGSELKSTIAGQVPIWLEAGARIADHFFAGAYFDYGFGVLASETSDACRADQASAIGAGVDVSCNTNAVRLGAEFSYHIFPKRQFDPWLGAGFGYEWFALSETASVGANSATLTIGTHGFEVMNLQLGLDISVSENTALGPFTAFTLARYRKATLGCSGECSATAPADSSVDIDDKTLHEWLLFGARVTYRF
jgi:hypothetical protein